MSFFQGINKILDKAINLDEKEAFIFAIDDETKRLIIDLNTKNQLGQDGIDSLGDSLGSYADFTIQKKLTEGVGVGSIVDHVTFFDSGRYWRSWNIEVNGDFLTIVVDQDRFNELVNDLGFDAEHVGLTEENRNVLVKELIKRYRGFVRMKLGI